MFTKPENLLPKSIRQTNRALHAFCGLCNSPIEQLICRNVNKFDQHLPSRIETLEN